MMFLLFFGILLILVGVYGINVYNSLFGVKQYVYAADNGYVTLITTIKHDGVIIYRWEDTILSVDIVAFAKARKSEGKDLLTLYKYDGK